MYLLKKKINNVYLLNKIIWSTDLVTEKAQSADKFCSFSRASFKFSALVNGDVAWRRTRLVTSFLLARNSAAPHIDGAESVAVIELRRKTAAPAKLIKISTKTFRRNKELRI